MTNKTLTADLLTWGKSHSPHVLAAVKLLIDHDYWLRRADFIKAAVQPASDGSYIVWRKAREAFDAGTFNRSSTSELAVLDFAIALGEDRFHLGNMGRHNSRLLVDALAAALDVEVAEVSR